MSPAPVRVEIGVLSLAGVSRPRARAIADSVRQELARLLGSDAMQRELRIVASELQGRRVATLDGGSIPVARDRPERLGTRIATQVSRGLLDAHAPSRERP